MAVREKNLCGKRRPLENPYEIWRGYGACQGWEWRVLKKYQTPTREKENPYARWHCAVKSPFTFGSWEYGDTYIKDIVNYAIKDKAKAAPLGSKRV